MGVGEVVGPCDSVGCCVAKPEGEQAATDDIHPLCRRVRCGCGVLGGCRVVGDEWHIFFQAGVEVDGDGVVASHTGVEGGGAGHTGEVGVAIHLSDAPVVVVQDDLCEVDVGDGPQGHVEFFHIYVTLLVELEAAQVTIDLHVRVVGGEQRLGGVERGGIAGSLVARGLHSGVGFGGDVVQRGGLVEDQALHTVQRVYLVPDEQVPEAPFEVALEVGLLQRVALHPGVRRVGLVAQVVTAQLEHLRLGVTDLAKDLNILQVPAVVPLRLPVVGDVVTDLVVPKNLQVQIHSRELKLGIGRVVEVQHRLTLAGGEGEDKDPPPGPSREGGEQAGAMPSCAPCYSLGYGLYHSHFSLFSIFVFCLPSPLHHGKGYG